MSLNYWRVHVTFNLTWHCGECRPCKGQFPADNEAQPLTLTVGGLLKWTISGDMQPDIHLKDRYEGS